VFLYQQFLRQSVCQMSLWEKSDVNRRNEGSMLHELKRENRACLAYVRRPIIIKMGFEKEPVAFFCEEVL
jgi:hypothetical protein